jgi:hypothetical protein
MKGRPESAFLEHFSDKFMDHIRQVCTFAKLVPGFRYLHHDDQVALLKSCVFEVLLMRLAGLFDNQVMGVHKWYFVCAVAIYVVFSSSKYKQRREYYWQY